LLLEIRPSLFSTVIASLTAVWLSGYRQAGCANREHGAKMAEVVLSRLRADIDRLDELNNCSGVNLAALEQAYVVIVSYAVQDLCLGLADMARFRDVTVYYRRKQGIPRDAPFPPVLRAEIPAARFQDLAA
jgi:hypothetical protein